MKEAPEPRLFLSHIPAKPNVLLCLMFDFSIFICILLNLCVNAYFCFLQSAHRPYVGSHYTFDMYYNRIFGMILRINNNRTSAHTAVVLFLLYVSESQSIDCSVDWWGPTSLKPGNVY